MREMILSPIVGGHEVLLVSSSFLWLVEIARVPIAGSHELVMPALLVVMMIPSNRWEP